MVYPRSRAARLWNGTIMKANIVLLPGDGIGPEVVREAVRVLDAIAGKYQHEWAYQECLMGGCSIDRCGSSLTDETLAICQAADAVLLGAVGGPKWDDPNARIAPSAASSPCARGSAYSPTCGRSRFTRR
jgi:isocitrate/isopropylmalate dehydrogenase